MNVCECVFNLIYNPSLLSKGKQNKLRSFTKVNANCERRAEHPFAGQNIQQLNIQRQKSFNFKGISWNEGSLKQRNSFNLHWTTKKGRIFHKI